MKVQRQKTPKLRKFQSKANKAASAAWTVKRGIKGGLLSSTIGHEEEEENVKMQLTGPERKAWEKLSRRKKQYFLGPARQAAEKKEAFQAKEAGWMGQETIGQGRAQGEKRPEPRKGAGREQDCGKFQAVYGKPGKKGKPQGPRPRQTKAGAALPTSAAGNLGPSAAGPAGGAAMAAASAKRAAEKFRRSLLAAQEASGKEPYFQRTAEEKAAAALESPTLTGKVTGMLMAAAAYLAAKAVVGATTILATLVGMLAAFLPAVVCIVVLATLLVSLLFSGGEGPSGSGNKMIVAVAQAEYEAAEENIGGFKYKDWYGLNDNWCAMFVSWCADQCGYIESGIVPRSASCAAFQAWYEAKGLYHDKAGYTPKPGDFFLNGGNHIGIVEAFDEVSQTFTIYDGNCGTSGTSPYHLGSRVSSHTMSMADPALTGFCSPDYPAGVGELVGGTNAEMVYRAFLEAGYTKEASAAAVGNLAGEGGVDEDGDILINSTEAGSGEGIGMCQWSFGRKDAFLAYAESQNDPWPGTSLATQIAFLMKELTGNNWLWTAIGAEYGSQYHISHAQFKESQDVAFATTAFCANFERPHAANANLEARIQYARSVLAKYGDGGPQTEEGEGGTEGDA